MKKVLLVACAIVMGVAVNVHAAFPVDSYIGAIASLAGPKSEIPTPPRGYGAVRDEQTGDFLVLIPREYCKTSAPPGSTIPLGRTMYGSQIRGYCAVETTSSYPQGSPPATATPNQCYAAKTDPKGTIIKENGNVVPDFSKPVPCPPQQ